MSKKELLEKLRTYGYDKSIVSAFDSVDRSRFVPLQYAIYSYADRALPIGFEQTISQPSTIAFMLDLLDLKNNLKILEVGSGSGYVLALLAEIVAKAKIFGTERIGELAAKSQKKLHKHKNVTIIHTPMGLGLPEQAPFDRILVSAASNVISQELLKQLSDNGIMVEPVGNSIIKAVKKNGNIVTEEYPGFVFVKLHI